MIRNMLLMLQKLKKLKWLPHETFESGIKKTVEWYLENKLSYDKIINGKKNRRLELLKNERHNIGRWVWF